MSSTMLSFVLQNTPPEWEEVDYSESYVLFDLRMFSSEYEDIEKLFRPSLLNIKSIKRVQQPFQYGRFKLRQEMLGRYTLETVFHAIDKDDVDIALKYTCDYRRYLYKEEGLHYTQKQPVFFKTVDDAMNYARNMNSTHFSTVLVVCKISGPTTTQSDYFIRYVVETGTF